MSNRVVVFSTSFCVKCGPLKKKLEAEGIFFENIDAIKFPLAVKEFKVKSVPTTFVLSENDNSVLYEKAGEFVDFDKVKELISV